MTRHELAQTVASQAKLFKGHTDGRWYETGQNGYMTVEFPTTLKATMFAQYLIWEDQLEAYLPDNMDIEDNNVIVTVKGR